MYKSKFLMGLSMGIVGCNFYNSYKTVLKQGIVKAVENAIVFGENTNSFLKEAKDTAQQLNQENYKKANESIRKENENDMTERIDNLKKQLTEIQQQLSIL